MKKRMLLLLVLMAAAAVANDPEFVCVTVTGPSGTPVEVCDIAF